MTWMLRLYPRAWRERYGEEVAEHLASEPGSFRLGLDLLAGAVDARMNPQWIPESTPNDGGKKAMSSILRLCSRPPFTPEEKRRSSAWLIGSSLGFVALALALQFLLDQKRMGEILLLSAYPIGLILSSHHTWLEPYPRPVRIILTLLAGLAMFLFFLGVTFLADRF